MRKRDDVYPTSYALLATDLYISFPFRKYLSICDDFQVFELRAICGNVLKQLFYYVINDIIENNVLFKFPPGAKAWLELKPFSGEDFKIARQNGAFEDVDFLASGFTGYLMVLRKLNRYGTWTKRMYLSSKYRDRITELTNKGKQLASARQKLIRDYVNDLQKVFPILPKSEINRICTYGLRQFAYANTLHCDILLCGRTLDVYTAYCGKLYQDDQRFWRNWYMKYRMKERLLYHLRREKWDGYYYIGLREDEHQKIIKQKNKKKFGDVFLVKAKKELYHERWCYHIWRVPYLLDCGWKFLRENLITDKAEYVEPNKYATIHKHFKPRDGV